MPPLAERVLVNGEAFTGSLEAIETAEELERRREPVKQGESCLLTEDESWASIRAAGYNV